MQRFNLDDFWSRSSNDPFEETTLGRILKSLPDLGPNGPWLAGGALRRTIMGKEPDSDFDFFFRDADQLNAFAVELAERNFNKARETEHHLHYVGMIEGEHRDVQLIRFKYYNDVSDVIDSFDFTICQLAYDGQYLALGDMTLWDIGRRRLAINRITYPVSTMRRMLKYSRQGFTACAGCMAQLLRETATSPELMTQLSIEYID